MNEATKILIVDDDPDRLRAHSRLLRKAGYQVIEATTGQEGIHLAQETEPDLILLDVVLPDIDGIGLCQLIKADEAIADSCVVLLSGTKTAPESQAEGLEAGADGYIVGPISNQELLARVEAMIRLKKTEGALRRERDLVARIMETSPVGIVVLDRQGRIAFANAQVERVTGLAKDEIIGCAYNDPRWRMTDKDGSLLPDEMLPYPQVMSTGQPIYNLHYAVELGQQRLFLSLNATPLFDGLGQLDGVVVTVEDITERKRAEEALQQLTHDLRERVKELNCLHGISGLSGRQNISLEEILQGTVDLMPAAWQHSEIACARIIVEGREFRTEDFQETGWKQTSDLILHGKRIGAIEVHYLEERPEGDEGPFFKEERNLIDAVAERLGRIIERVRAEEALERVRFSIDRVLDSVFWVGSDGCFIDVNDTACRNLGYSRDELLSMCVADVDPNFPREVWPSHWDDMKRLGIMHIESVHQAKDGRTFPVEIAIHNMQFQDKHYNFVLARDIAERKRAEERLRKTHGELATLLAISNDIVSTLELNPLLNLILGQLKKVVDYSGAAILTLAQDIMRFQAYQGPDLEMDILSLRFSPAQVPMIQQMIASQQAFYIADIQDDPSLAQAIEVATGLPVETISLNGRSWLGVPLIVKDQAIGMLSLVHEQPDYYEPQALNLAQAFANQVAIAIENARLYQQAQETAALTERARLARELHDSVTQALYSVNLYADATRLALSSGKTDVAAENLHQLRSLAGEALSDMRLLIFELRPSILEEAGLVGALQARLEAVEARSGFQTAFQVEGERRLPPSIEAELYRVAQEAFNNVIKHAQAKQVTVHLKFDEERFCLTIQDDGIGFDPGTASRSGGLGLRSIRERVQKIGGNLILETAPEKGTTLRIEVDA